MKKCFLSTPHPSCMMCWWVLVLLLWSDETEEKNEGDMLKLSYTWTELFCLFVALSLTVCLVF
jgi:hypothetical protein